MLRLWEIETGDEQARLQRPGKSLQNITVLPAGNQFLTGGGGFWDGKKAVRTGDNTLRLWRLPARARANGTVIL
ncbi:hypothetical protein [Rubinisphaera margarita]|uniref:hypothetical protein n=1 Tax=Rubinisphaera margarita TaxID=2909586 RepID=UPI001EE998A6|nr:hypothetical protein [Rubinisphaera margarita]MCG6158149.1 hypothetical protein [Rubinisphaera margarita]